MVVVFEELHDLKGVWSELAKIWEQVRIIILQHFVVIDKKNIRSIPFRY